MVDNKSHHFPSFRAFGNSNNYCINKPDEDKMNGLSLDPNTSNNVTANFYAYHYVNSNKSACNTKFVYSGQIDQNNLSLFETGVTLQKLTVYTNEVNNCVTATCFAINSQMVCEGEGLMGNPHPSISLPKDQLYNKRSDLIPLNEDKQKFSKKRDSRFISVCD